MTGWERWSTGNCARNSNRTIRKSSMCTNQNLSWRMRRTKYSNVQTDHIIPARILDRVIHSKKKKKKKKNEKRRTCWIVDFAIPADHRLKIKENEKGDKYYDLARELKKDMEHRSDSDTNCKWYAQNNPQRFGKGAGRVGKRGTSRDHPNYSILGRILETLGDLLSLKLQWTKISWRCC